MRKLRHGKAKSFAKIIQLVGGGAKTRDQAG